MSACRFGRTPGGVCWPGLHVVWCPEYRLGVAGGPVAHRLGELLEQIAVEHRSPFVVKEVMTDHMHLRDAVAS